MNQLLNDAADIARDGPSQLIYLRIGFRFAEVLPLAFAPNTNPEQFSSGISQAD